MCYLEASGVVRCCAVTHACQPFNPQPLDSALLLEELAECSDNADDKEWIRKNAIMHVSKHCISES